MIVARITHATRYRIGKDLDPPWDDDYDVPERQTGENFKSDNFWLMHIYTARSQTKKWPRLAGSEIYMMLRI